MSRTYTELLADLQNWMEDDDVEFTGSIPRLINLAELRVVKDLDLSIFHSNDTVPTVASDDTVLRPTGSPNPFIVVQSIFYNNGGERTFLELRSTDFVRDFAGGAANGPPKYYAEFSETEWTLAPVPDAVYSLVCRGIARPDPLGPMNDTNWLSDNVDDLLFAGAKAQSEGYLKADDRIDLWKTEYVELLAVTKRELYELMGERYNLTPMEVPAFPTNQR